MFSPNHENPSPGNAAPPPPDVVPIAGPSPKTTPTPKDPIALLSRLLTPTLKPSSPLWSPQHRGPPPPTTPSCVAIAHLASLSSKGGGTEGRPWGRTPPSRAQQPHAGGGQRTGGQRKGALPPPPPRPSHRASYGERVGAKAPAVGRRETK